MKEFFDNNNDQNKYAMIGYKTINTMSLNGSVKRGVCTEDDKGYLTKLVEASIEKVEDKIIATPLEDEKNSFEIKEDTLVSMNFFGFNTSIFDYLEDEMKDFFEKHKNDLEKCEFLIPNSVFKRIDENKVSVKVLDTDEKWYGVTYKEDKKDLVNAINKMIEEGKYPKNLWN